MPNNSDNAILTKIGAYFKGNWGAPFVIGFMVLLTVTAMSVSMGLEFFANQMATYSYYALSVGVVLQIVSFAKEQKKRKS